MSSLRTNQSINLYRAIVQRRVLQYGYAESKRNVLRRILNVLTDGTVQQFSGREFQSLGAATEKRRAAVSIRRLALAGKTFCVDGSGISNLMNIYTMTFISSVHCMSQ